MMIRRLIDSWKRNHEKEVCGVGFIREGSKSLFASACKIHDREYLDKYEDRKDIDERFLENMLKTVEWRVYLRKRQNKGTKVFYVFYKTKAYFYYGLARIFGGIVW